MQFPEILSHFEIVFVPVPPSDIPNNYNSTFIKHIHRSTNTLPSIRKLDYSDHVDHVLVIILLLGWSFVQNLHQENLPMFMVSI